MKKMILNIMATTGIVIMVLAGVALCYDATVIFIGTMFQILVVNTVIHLGCYAISFWEYPYPILETGLKLAYVLGVVLLSGWLLGWYANLSVFVLGLMTVAVFAISVCLDTLSLRTEVKEINGLLGSSME